MAAVCKMTRLCAQAQGTFARLGPQAPERKIQVLSVLVRQYSKGGERSKVFFEVAAGGEKLGRIEFEVIKIKKT
jgi:hypothetical protein